ncbi:ABC transporter permease [Cryobacterium tepidiphilum]|uniref:ABC transporter permease n=2 Tax=Cryobacterium tepidiphilum TaxID=2486026 RepID=A0A3M8LHL2_9MICO|nr:ABC transporter permease [Cryobacterium tepidiphilum]
MLVLTLLAFAIFTAVKPRVFLNPLNLQNIAIAAPEIGLLALAIMLTMLTGGIDLSIVAIANLTAITISSLYTAIGATDAGLAESLAPVIVLVGLAVGAVGGYVNGLLVSRVGITPILATLGTMQIFNGIAITWTGGKTLYGAPAMLTTFGRTVIAGIPALFLVLVAAAIVLAVVINKTALGATIRLQGANPVAARFSGIRTDRTLTSTYVMSGLLAGLAGILFVSRNPTASADYGSSYVLLVIVIAVLGGTNPNGGFGTVLGVILATLTLQIVSSGFNIIRLSSYDYAIAQGAILIIIMVIDQVTSGRRRRTVPKISDALATPTES